MPIFEYSFKRKFPWDGFLKTTLYHGGWKYDLYKLYLRHMQPSLRQGVDVGTRSDAGLKYTRSAWAHTHAPTQPLGSQLFTSRWMLVNVPNPFSLYLERRRLWGLELWMNPYLDGIDCKFVVNNLKCLVSDSCAALETKRYEDATAIKLRRPLRVYFAMRYLF